MSNNGASSYQKYDGSTGTYQQVQGDLTPRRNNGKNFWLVGGLGVAAALAVGIFYMISGPSAKSATPNVGSAVEKEIVNSGNVQYNKNGKLKLFDKFNRFVLEDFDAKSTFASFLPGVAGYFGKPVWAFYVNRGQGLATFGTESKEYPILEFNSANKAYQLTPFVGFRTFVRGTRGSGSSFQAEPFAPSRTRNLIDDDDDKSKPKRILYVGRNEMEIEEIDALNGLSTNVQYIVLPEEDFASLVRRTTLTNTGDSDLTISVLDGLAKIEPFGGRLDWGLKQMGRTLEGWMGVYHADETLAMPFYKLSTETSDSAAVKIEVAGHYCLSFIESADKTAELLPVVYDTVKVFGADTSLELPLGLHASSVGEILENPQYGWATTSSAFPAVEEITIAPGESITIASVYGQAEHMEQVKDIADVVTAPGYIAEKYERARNLITEITAGVETSTVNPLFDGTVQQMFLDNSLRGGFPTVLGAVDSDKTYDEDPEVKIFHSFSRIHGDLERDYNAFSIEPTYFSQGPGNYRDIAQNRRNDVTFFPRMASFNIKMFLSYIQADGYEPLTVEAVVYRFEDPEVAREVARKVTADAKSADTLGKVLNGGPFRPGQVFKLCDQLNIKLGMKNEDAINTILAKAQDRAMAVYGQGYWADHWDYYMDLIEAYLAVFPDQEEELMYDNKLRYFFSTATVKARSDKYVLTLTYNGTGEHVQQLDATYFDKQKADEQEAFRNQNTGLIGIEANWQRTEEGQPFMSTPIAKLFLLGAIKFAMRDAWGMGIEYEGGRPGWLDSMNGLPGMVGSGMPETYELKLLLEYVQKVVDKYDRPVVIPSEAATMIATVTKALKTLKKAGYEDPEKLPLDVPKPLFEYWDVVAAARESYRNDVEYYFSGNETTYEAKEVSKMISDWLAEIEIGIERSFKFATEGYMDDGTSGIPASYFSYDITDYKKNKGRNDVGLPLVNALAMRVRKFPLFLEGPVRYMKVIMNDHDKMKDMYQRVLKSGLRDTVLKMYFLSASLTGQTYDMGRQIAFAPGWLENQSIWMHMSYKYYLQLLRGKLYEEFFEEFKSGGILPFMDPDVYGRSLMECSSFIASSAFPDPSIVGNGFLARLSGSTAEFMDIWKLMFIGPKLFSLNDDDQVVMELSPALPSWLFEDEASDNDPTLDEDGNHVVSFKLFGAIDVTYHNPGGDNLYGVSPKKYEVTMKSGDVTKVDGPVIQNDLALTIRRVASVDSIDAYF